MKGCKQESLSIFVYKWRHKGDEKGRAHAEDAGDDENEGQQGGCKDEVNEIT